MGTMEEIMRNHERKESEVMINVIDFTSLEEKASEHIQKENFKTNHHKIKVQHEWGYVETPVGLYVLCNEGVGDQCPVSSENAITFYFIRQYKCDKGSSFDITPCLSITCNDEDVAKLDVKETVLLSDFIRGFGSRLESNYNEWNNFLSGELKKKGNYSINKKKIELEKEQEEFEKSEEAELLG
jgi:hypothetical protein